MRVCFQIHVIKILGEVMRVYIVGIGGEGGIGDGIGEWTGDGGGDGVVCFRGVGLLFFSLFLD